MDISCLILRGWNGQLNNYWVETFEDKRNTNMQVLLLYIQIDTTFNHSTNILVCTGK